MSRELLFKAMDYEGNWVEGLPRQMWHNLSEQFEWFIDTTGFDADCTEVEIKKDTICQFTGLFDIDGNKIFEGDVLQSTRQNQTNEYKIVYRPACFWAVLQNQSMYLTDRFVVYWGLKVISNIHDEKEETN